MKKNILITGSSRGIGLACVKKFIDDDCNVVMASSNQKNLQESFHKIDNNSNLYYKKCNVSDENDVKELYSFCEEKIGKIDVLINCAAVIQCQKFLDFNLKDWQELMDINVKGTVLCCHYAFRHMIEKGGNIINISSLGGIQNFTKFPGFSSYVTSKFAITGLTESLAVEGKEYGIRVNAIAPGAVDTEMLKKAAPQLKSSTKPEDIANNIFYLCNDKYCHHITGTIFTINCND